MPTFLGQRRPWMCGSLKSFEGQLKLGLPKKLGGNSEKSGVSFTLWMGMLSAGLNQLGLDTVFRIPDKTWTEESTIFTDHTITWSSAKTWVKQLQEGVLRPTRLGQIVMPVCMCDVQNLRCSAMCILASLTSTFRREIVQSVGIDASGVQVLIKVIGNKLHLVLSLQRDLIAQLQGVCISNVEGEHIPTLNLQIKEVCETICHIGEPPLDLNQIVVKCHMNSQVTIFTQAVGTLCLALEKDPKCHPWTELLELMEDCFRQFKHLWTPTKAKPAANKEFQNFKQGLTNQFNQLKAKVGNPPNSSTNTSTSSNKVCWDCGKKDAVMGHPGCAKKGQGLHKPDHIKKKEGKSSNGNRSGGRSGTPPADAPKSGESETRTKNGQVEKHCSKCRCPQWRSGDKAHVSSDHKGRGDWPAKVPGHLAMTSTPIATIETAFAGIGLSDPTDDTMPPGLLLPPPTAAQPAMVAPLSAPTGTLSMHPGLMCHIGTDDVDPDAEADWFQRPAFDCSDDEEDLFFYDAEMLTEASDSKQVSTDDDVFYDCVSSTLEDDFLQSDITDICDSFSPLDFIALFACVITFLIFILGVITAATTLLPRSVLPAMSLLAISFSLVTFGPDVWQAVLMSSHIQNGPRKGDNAFACPARLMTLSCVMLTMSFVSMFLEVNDNFCLFLFTPSKMMKNVRQPEIQGAT